MLSEVSEHSSYWESSYNFYESVKEKPHTHLSIKQRDWLVNISDQLDEAYSKYVN